MQIEEVVPTSPTNKDAVHHNNTPKFVGDIYTSVSLL